MVYFNVLDKQLNERSGHIGHQATKVLFRGYHTSCKLQGLHDRAAENTDEGEHQGDEVAVPHWLQVSNEHQWEALEQNMKLEKLQHAHQLKEKRMSWSWPDNLFRMVTTGKGGNPIVHIHPQSIWNLLELVHGDVFHTVCMCSA